MRGDVIATNHIAVGGKLRPADGHFTKAGVNRDIPRLAAKHRKRSVAVWRIKAAIRRGDIGGPVVVAGVVLPDTITAVNHAVVFKRATRTTRPVPEAHDRSRTVHQVNLAINGRLHVEIVCRCRRCANIQDVVGQRTGVVEDAINADIKGSARCLGNIEFAVKVKIAIDINQIVK
ncbi:hypothetical protein D3C75_496900 [compost metagenome]